MLDLQPNEAGPSGKSDSGKKPRARPDPPKNSIVILQKVRNQRAWPERMHSPELHFKGVRKSLKANRFSSATATKHAPGDRVARLRASCRKPWGKCPRGIQPLTLSLPPSSEPWQQGSKRRKLLELVPRQLHQKGTLGTCHFLRSVSHDKSVRLQPSLYGPPFKAPILLRALNRAS